MLSICVIDAFESVTYGDNFPKIALSWKGSVTCFISGHTPFREGITSFQERISAGDSSFLPKFRDNSEGPFLIQTVP